MFRCLFFNFPIRALEPSFIDRGSGNCWLLFFYSAKAAHIFAKARLKICGKIGYWHWPSRVPNRGLIDTGIRQGASFILKKTPHLKLNYWPRSRLMQNPFRFNVLSPTKVSSLSRHSIRIGNAFHSMRSWNKGLKSGRAIFFRHFV